MAFLNSLLQSSRGCPLTPSSASLPFLVSPSTSTFRLQGIWGRACLFLTSAQVPDWHAGGRASIQRDLPLLESWACANLQVQGPAWVGAIPNVNLGWAENGLRAALMKRSWGCSSIRSSKWASDVCPQPRKPIVLWAALKEIWSAGQGRCFSSSTQTSWDLT